MKSEKSSSTSSRASWDKTAERVGRKVGKATNELENDAQRLVQYLNDEVIPAVRQHSTTALRSASQMLSEFADMMDDEKRKKKG